MAALIFSIDVLFYDACTLIAVFLLWRGVLVFETTSRLLIHDVHGQSTNGQAGSERLA